LKKPWRRIW